MLKLQVANFYIDCAAFCAKRLVAAKVGAAHPGAGGISAMLILKYTLKHKYLFSTPMLMR